jgi:hypothetical protein
MLYEGPRGGAFAGLGAPKLLRRTAVSAALPLLSPIARLSSPQN